MTLKYDVYVSPSTRAEPVLEGDSPFNWSPVSSTLIYGKRSAILVDTAITIQQNTKLAAWVESKLQHDQIELSAIYITHGHADHFLGANILLARYPRAKILATKETLAHMKQQLEPTYFQGFWAGFFPNQLPSDLPTDASFVQTLSKSNMIDLEGHVLEVIKTGHTDTFDTTVLWVPDLELAICGDVVYGDVHLYMGEARVKEKRLEWVSALEKVKALKPTIVVAGHKKVDGRDDAHFIDATISYINMFQSLLDSGITDIDVLYKIMMKTYSDRANDHALLGSCWAAKASGFQ